MRGVFLFCMLCAACGGAMVEENVIVVEERENSCTQIIHSVNKCFCYVDYFWDEESRREFTTEICWGVGGLACFWDVGEGLLRDLPDTRRTEEIRNLYKEEKEELNETCYLFKGQVGFSQRQERKECVRDLMERYEERCEE